MSDRPVSAARRAFLASGGAALAILGLRATRWLSEAHAKTIATTPGKVTIVRFSDAGARLGEETVDKVVKSEAEWRGLLSPLAFKVTRQEGTEYPGSGAYALQPRQRPLSLRVLRYGAVRFRHQVRVRHRVAELLAADRQTDVVETEDRSLGMVRTAVLCARCDSHLGHVFDEAPSRRACATA